ncbi:MAG: hypothetical protein AB1657_03885 [Candidatus Micrarchaeota archaeon]
MRMIALLFLGAMFLFLGCVLQPEQPPQQEAPPQQEPPREVFCSDGTPADSCSPAKPFYCTNSGALIEDPEFCGCPSGTALQDEDCVSLCSDGTLPGRCSQDRPFFCTDNSTLVEMASRCGCPSGATRSGDTCAFLCSDRTPAGECSPSQPYYCTETLALYPDPGRCGCPPGTIEIGGACAEAKCIDGTPVGTCASFPPNYCNEELELVLNPAACGCTDDTILSADNSTCVGLRSSSQREDEYSEVAPGVSMRVRNSEHIECENADYISVDLSMENEGASPLSVSEGDVPLLFVAENDGWKWLPVRYPENDSYCDEVAPFPFGRSIEPGSTDAGIVWYRLVEFDRYGAYYVYYKTAKRVRLGPME